MSEHYSELLDLYDEIGFGPAAGYDRELWREQSLAAWLYLDNLLPGSTTVGIHDGKLVSSWGTLPCSATVLYTHSGCMFKSLPGAITLMAQALLSVRWFDRLPEMECLAMAYSYESRFTTQFQRPLNFTIPHQLETESLLCTPQHIAVSMGAQRASVAELRGEDRYLLTTNHLRIFDAYSVPYPSLGSLHAIRHLRLSSSVDGAPLALLLIQEGPPFLTAADVHRETLVFPVSDFVDVSQICHELRSLEQFKSRVLYIFLRPGTTAPTKIDGEMLDQSFWIATQRGQAELLRRSYVEAFTPLIHKYSEAEVIASLKGIAKIGRSDREI